MSDTSFVTKSRPGSATQRAGGSFRLSIALPRPRPVTRHSYRKLAPNPGHARNVSADLVYFTQQFGPHRQRKPIG